MSNYYSALPIRSESLALIKKRSCESSLAKAYDSSRLKQYLNLHYEEELVRNYAIALVQNCDQAKPGAARSHCQSMQ